MRKEIIAFCAACAALVSVAKTFTPTPAYTNTWTEDGITYAQLGGVKNSNAVVTAVNTTIIGSVRSVNGKVGNVTLDHSDVGALPDTTPAVTYATPSLDTAEKIAENARQPFFRGEFTDTFPSSVDGYNADETGNKKPKTGDTCIKNGNISFSQRKEHQDIKETYAVKSGRVGNRNIALVGSRSYGLWVSYDGENFSRIKNGKWLTVGIANGVAYAFEWREIYALVDECYLYTSTDGSTFNLVKQVPFAAYHTAGSNDDYYDLVLDSSHGVKFYNPLDGEFYDCTYSGASEYDMDFVNGYYFIADTSDKLHRATGRVYSEIASGIVKFRCGMGMIVGLNGSNKFTYSTDNGETWTATTFSPGGVGNRVGIAYGDGLFVAIGEGGSFFSKDGISWQKFNNDSSYGNNRKGCYFNGWYLFNDGSSTGMNGGVVGYKVSRDSQRKMYLYSGNWDSDGDSGWTEIYGMTDDALLNIVRGKVDKSQMVNGKPLTGSVVLDASDVGALPADTTHLSGDVPVTRTINGQTLENDITIEATPTNAVIVTNGVLQTKSGDAIGADALGAVPTNRTINGQALTDDITIQTMPDNGLVLSQDGKIRTSNQQTQIIPSHIGAASANAVEETQAIVQTWEGFLDGSNVVFSITNYISNTYNLKAAKLRILEMRDGEYREVYNSRDEIILHLADFETNKLIAATNAVTVGVDAKIADKAPLAWGRVSSMGTPVEEGMVIINEPQTMFAGGTDWHRVALGEGSVCVLKTAGAPTYTAGDEGVFKFQDDGGTNYFGFAKTDSYTIGCNTDGIVVENQIVTLQYDITGATPCIWYKEHINTDEPWEQLNLPDGSPVSGASHLVQWRPDAGSGTRYCDINCQEGSGFFKATVEMSGSAKFITNMPADFSAGILCTDGIHKVAVDWNNGNPRLVEVQ